MAGPHQHHPHRLDHLQAAVDTAVTAVTKTANEIQAAATELLKANAASAAPAAAVETAATRINASAAELLSALPAVVAAAMSTAAATPAAEAAANEDAGDAETTGRGKPGRKSAA